jgi:hypothetical protein
LHCSAKALTLTLSVVWPVPARWKVWPVLVLALRLGLSKGQRQPPRLEPQLHKICLQLHQRDWKRFQQKVSWKRFHNKNQRLYCQTADLTMQT